MEITNKTLILTLKKLVRNNFKTWQDSLSEVLRAFQTVYIKKALKTSPFILIYDHSVILHKDNIVNYLEGLHNVT